MAHHHPLYEERWKQHPWKPALRDTRGLINTLPANRHIKHCIWDPKSCQPKSPNMFFGKRFDYDACRKSRTERMVRAGCFVSPPPRRAVGGSGRRLLLSGASSESGSAVSTSEYDEDSDAADVLIGRQQGLTDIPIGDWSPPSSAPSTGRGGGGGAGPSSSGAAALLDTESQASAFTEATGASLLHYLSDPDDAGGGGGGGPT